MEDEPIEPMFLAVKRQRDWTLNFLFTVVLSVPASPGVISVVLGLAHLLEYTIELQRLSRATSQYTVLPCRDLQPFRRSLRECVDLGIYQVSCDLVRMFAGLQDMDGKRALWSLKTSPDACDPVFKRFMDVSILMGNVVYELPECHECRAEPRFCYKPDCLAKLIGNALWQVSCHVPRSLSPSPPPPPYTLHAFNIELPPIDFQTAKTRGYTVGRTVRVEKRKRSDPEDVGHIRTQRLLRSENKSRVCSESIALETQNSLSQVSKASTNQQACYQELCLPGIWCLLA